MIEYIEYPIKSLSKQRARTFLTLLGMIIGIAVIVAMISIGEGMKLSMDQMLDKMGTDKISIFPAGGFGSGMGPAKEAVPFRYEEHREIERIPGVESAAPYFMKSGTVEFRNEKETTIIGGGTEKGMDMFKEFYSLEEGRYFGDHEEGVINVGHWVANHMFDKEVHVGDSLKINGEKFRVIGVYGEIGNRGDDSSIYMPLEVAQNLFDSKNEFHAIFVLCDSEKIVDAVAQKIEDRLKKMRGGKDFDIMTTRQMAEQINKILMIVEFVLAGIASVSIVVGGVIIMNTMLMSVLERTREIGIMKATGATDNVVLSIFLVESGLVGMIGGALGIVLGSIISKVIEVVGQEYIGSMFITVISKEVATGALLFSLIIGSVSGAYPAWKAAKLDPVEALRYE
jgi:putative ABC transport system permease protein